MNLFRLSRISVTTTRRIIPYKRCILTATRWFPCGGEILDHFKSLEGVNEGALYHHERYDGKGYPKGLAGEEIPLIARIICVADSFDTMNSNRVYRKKLTQECIINEIELNKGRQFDPVIADVMLKLLRGSGSLFDL